MPEHDAQNPFDAGGARPATPWANSRAWSQASRRYAQWRAQPSWARRLATGLVLLIFVGLAAILLVSSLMIGLLVVGAGALAAALGAAIRRIRGGPSLSEGRKNVRVIVRQHP